jgi:hypothetical protein
MAVAVILADMRFYIDFNDYIDAVLGLVSEDEDEDYDE